MGDGVVSHSDERVNMVMVQSVIVMRGSIYTAPAVTQQLQPINRNYVITVLIFHLTAAHTVCSIYNPLSKLCL